MDCCWLAVQAALAFLTGWKAAHCKLECDIDSPTPIWVRVARVFTG